MQWVVGVDINWRNLPSIRSDRHPPRWRYPAVTDRVRSDTRRNRAALLHRASFVGSACPTRRISCWADPSQMCRGGMPAVGAARPQCIPPPTCPPPYCTAEHQTSTLVLDTIALQPMSDPMTTMMSQRSSLPDESTRDWASQTALPAQNRQF